VRHAGRHEHASPRSRLERLVTGAKLELPGEHTVQAALALIAREAVELLTGPDRGLIRECAAAPDCSLLYLDRSRARRRRWCQMEICGSRAKMTSYRRRRTISA
jgi:predicted RNA-binding Zn ribbon-like protein